MTKATQTVQSAPQVVVTNDIRDIRPPVIIRSAWTWLGWTLLALAVALVLFRLGRAWVAKRAAKPASPPVPPHVRARQRLQEALAFIAQPKPFCIRVSDTVRIYLEERFAFRAPERTTEEFLHELRHTHLLTTAQKDRLGDFLQRCDLVKFAKYEPAEPELRELHAAAARLVEETEPPPEPSAPAPAPAVGTPLPATS